MSKPTPLYHCVAVGFGSNRRKLALERLIGERANYLPIALWNYAALNQMDGDFSDYEPEDFQHIWQGWGLNLDIRTCRRYVQAHKAVGFITKNGSLHSFVKYNRYFTSYHQRQAAKAKWRKENAAKAEAAKAEAAKAEAAKGGNGHVPRSSDKEPPLFRQIESTELLLEKARKERKTLPDPTGDVRFFKGMTRDQIIGKRNEATNQIALLQKQLDELHERQAGVRKGAAV